MEKTNEKLAWVKVERNESTVKKRLCLTEDSISFINKMREFKKIRI